MIELLKALEVERAILAELDATRHRLLTARRTMAAMPYDKAHAVTNARVNALERLVERLASPRVPS
jgi:hypothetical protein